ncbi:hypothetical protein CBS101457_005366 [Exobasidium rhododendri]|nr:hypothetical protein CBS101457_005366 [Exobasidium rhododendri]
MSSSPPFVKAPRPKRILVIGGGVAGLAALRALVEEGGTSQGGPFESVELIERRDNIGGVWYLNDEVVKKEKAYPNGTASGHWPVPSSAPAHHTSNGANGKSHGASRPFWPSPAYPALRGNVLPQYLSLSGRAPFPPVKDAEDPYPTLSETQAYLEGVAEPLRRHIRCNVECLDVRELPGKQEGENRWAVRIRDWNHTQNDGPSTRTEYFDAVVLTIGWTDTPLFPRMPGLEEARLTGIVEHCKWYRGPEPYGTKTRVVVVGNGNSGNDVAAQLAGMRGEEEEVIYRIARHKPWYFYVSLPDPKIKDVPAMESMSLSEDGKRVHIKLIDGTTLENVDRVIFASGYELGKFPFVHLLSRQITASEVSLLPNSWQDDGDWKPAHASSSSSLDTLWKPLSSPPATTSFNTTDNPERVTDLYWQFLHARAGTLALINLSVTSIPFLTSDLQSHCLRAIWDGSLTSFSQSSLDDRLEYEKERLKWLSELKESEPERIRAAQEQYIKEVKSAGKDAYVLPEHTGAPPYHVLGTIVDDYGAALRSMAISAKPEWEKKLPDWHEQSKGRNAMYALKRTTLERKRAQGKKLV